MRGDIVYTVYGVHVGREEDVNFGTYRTVSEAQAKIATLKAGGMNGPNWAQPYHDKGLVIREASVDIDFEILSQLM